MVGERHLKLELVLEGKPLDAIQFGGWDGTPPPSHVRIAFQLEPDAYRGGEAIQLRVVHREADTPAPTSMPPQPAALST